MVSQKTHVFTLKNAEKPREGTNFSGQIMLCVLVYTKETYIVSNNKTFIARNYRNWLANYIFCA